MGAWRKRFLLYRMVGALPAGNRLFDVFRAWFGKLRNFNLATRNYSIQEMTHMLRRAGKSVAGRRLAEIGAGWHPILPILFHGLGAASIRMTDIVPHLRQKYVEQTLDYLLANAREIAATTGALEDDLRRRWAKLRPGRYPWRQVWRAQGITYDAPFDFSHTDWPSQALDMIYSNSCLAYVPEPVLEKIFKESTRLLAQGGWIAHNVDPCDSYAGADSTITPLNFLYYTRTEWDRIGNCNMHYQNRLRPLHYVQLAERHGLHISFQERLRYKLTPEMLVRSRLAPGFRGLPDDELLCFHFLLVATKP